MMLSCAKIFILLSLVCCITAKKHGYKYQGAEQQERSPGYDPKQNSEQDYDPGYTNQPAPEYVEQNAEFYAFEAPYDVHEDTSHLEQQFASALQKNLRVVFIRAPENKALAGAFHALAKHTSEDKTAIYVLNKQNDASELAVKLSALKSQHKSKPEVHFVKYKTQEEAVNAQRYIQEQYNQALPGAAQSYNGGKANVLNFASNYGGQPEQGHEDPEFRGENGYESQEPATGQLNGGPGPVLNFASNYGGQPGQGHEDSGFRGENGQGYGSQEPSTAQLNGGQGPVLNYGGQQELEQEDGFRGENKLGYGLQKPTGHLTGTGNGALYAGVGDPSAYDDDDDNTRESPVDLENAGYQNYPNAANPSTYVDSYGVKHASNGLGVKSVYKDAPATNPPSHSPGKGFFGGAAATSPFRSGIPLGNGAYYAGAGIASAYRGAGNKGSQTVSQGNVHGPLYDEGREADETDEGEYDAPQAYGISPRAKGSPQTLRVKDVYKTPQAYGISGRTKGSSQKLRIKDYNNAAQAGISARSKGYTQTDRVDFRINERQSRGPRMVFPKEKTSQPQYSHLQRFKRKQTKH